MTTMNPVRDYNLMMQARGQHIRVFTTGNGSMLDKPRVRGWVVWGDNSAKWYPNRKEAILGLKARS